jgi:hypothetical protein
VQGWHKSVENPPIGLKVRSLAATKSPLLQGMHDPLVKPPMTHPSLWELGGQLWHSEQSPVLMPGTQLSKTSGASQTVHIRALSASCSLTSDAFLPGKSLQEADVSDSQCELLALRLLEALWLYIRQ